MTEFKVGDKVRVNEGPLEGKSGFVAEIEENKVRVELDKTEMFAGLVPFYEDSLVLASEDSEPVRLLKLYPNLYKGEYIWRLTTYVDGLMFQSLPFGSDIIGMALRKPPSGLYAVEYIAKSEARTGNWKALWVES